MAFQNDDVTVKVGGDVYDLERGMVKGRKSVKDFETDVKKMGLRAAKVGVSVAAALAGITTATIAMVDRAASAAAEIGRLSDVAGVGAEEFQRYAVATKTVGIEQEKLADIFKDVNDKFGDFMATGAGPLADFFENIAPSVGVTADQFARLSGPEALQLYVSSLERAGVSQQQMTFYMEALASDATSLIPLLRDNGAAMQELGDEASRTGRVLDNETVAAGRRLEKQFADSRDMIRNEMITALISLEDEIQILAQFITDYGVPALETLVGWASSGAQAFDKLARAIKRIGGGDTRFFDPSTGEEEDQFGNPLDPRIGQPEDFSAPLKVDVEPPGSRVPLVNRNNAGGSGSGPDRQDFERLQQQFMEEAELIAEQRALALERLREFRESKLATEEEFNELEARINQDHADKLVEIERKANAAKLSVVQDTLSGIGSLMVSENEKLFKIGQASAVANAVVNGYSAAVAAWDKGMKAGGPGLAAAFTAASLAKTGSLIAGIKSQTATGGGANNSGGFGPGIGGSSSVQAQERQVAEFRFIGGNVLDPQAIVDAINDAYDRGIEIRAVRV